MDTVLEKMDALNIKLSLSLMDLADKQVKPQIDKMEAESKEQRSDPENTQDQKDKAEESIDGLEVSNFEKKRDHVAQIRTELKEAYEELMEFRGKLLLYK